MLNNSQLTHRPSAFHPPHHLRPHRTAHTKRTAASRTQLLLSKWVGTQDIQGRRRRYSGCAHPFLPVRSVDVCVRVRVSGCVRAWTGPQPQEQKQTNSVQMRSKEDFPGICRIGRISYADKSLMTEVYQQSPIYCSGERRPPRA